MGLGMIAERRKLAIFYSCREWMRGPQKLLQSKTFLGRSFFGRPFLLYSVSIPQGIGTSCALTVLPRGGAVFYCGRL